MDTATLIKGQPVRVPKSKIHSIYKVIFGWTRRRRMKRFMDRFHPTNETRILDVGGTPLNWKFIDVKPKLILLNIVLPKQKLLGPYMRYVVGDACDPPAEVTEWGGEIVFSNSVIEHVGMRDDQKRFADACMSLSKRLWVQTPARIFPIEPHYLTPFIHWLPYAWRKKVVRWTVWGLLSKPTPELIDHRVRFTHLLTYAQMKSLFPGCEIIVERFMFWPKAYIAVRG